LKITRISSAFEDVAIIRQRKALAIELASLPRSDIK
jgi:hypothetical protein